MALTGMVVVQPQNNTDLNDPEIVAANPETQEAGAVGVGEAHAPLLNDDGINVPTGETTDGPPPIAGDQKDDNDPQYIDEIFYPNPDGFFPDEEMVTPNYFADEHLKDRKLQTRILQATVPAGALGGGIAYDPVMLFPPDSNRAELIVRAMSDTAGIRPGTPLDTNAQAAVGAAGSATLAAAAGSRTYITGFELTQGGDGTGAVYDTFSITGLGTTLNYRILTNPGSAASQIMNVMFPQPIPASGLNTAIVGALAGAANRSSVYITLHGFQSGGGGGSWRFASDKQSCYTAAAMTLADFLYLQNHTGPVWVWSNDVQNVLSINGWSISK